MLLLFILYFSKPRFGKVIVMCFERIHIYDSSECYKLKEQHLLLQSYKSNHKNVTKQIQNVNI